MGMYHSTSGKAGFAGYKLPCDFEFTKPQIKAILTREDKLRASPETQARYTKREDFEWLRDVTLDVQERALRESLPRAVLELYSMPTLMTALHNLRFDPKVRNDPELNQLTVYQRMDKSHPGKASQGSPYIDVAVHDAVTGDRTMLSTYAVSRMHRLAESVEVVRFLGIYIAEAHASDEWPLGSVESRAQHKTLEERLEATRSFTKRYKWHLPMACDTISGDFEQAYGAWPERFLIINSSGDIELLGQPTSEFGYDRHDVSHWVNQYGHAEFVAGRAGYDSATRRYLRGAPASTDKDTAVRDGATAADAGPVTPSGAGGDAGAGAGSSPEATSAEDRPSAPSVDEAGLPGWRIAPPGAGGSASS